MAEKKQTDAPEKNGQAVLGGDKAPPDIPAKPPAPEEKAPASAFGGADQPAPEGKDEKAVAPPAPENKSRLIGVDFPSGKKIPIEETAKVPEPPGKAVPAQKDKGGDSPAARDKEQAGPDTKKKPARRSDKTADKAEKPEKPTARRGRPKKTEQTAPAKAEPEPPAPEQPAEPREAPRSGKPEQVMYIKLTELHPFKDHPFGVRDDQEMRALVESVREKGVNQPALVRPRPEGGYEIVAGHRRQKASELAGFTDMRCIVREMTDDEAVLAMTDDNLRQRTEILPSERAVSLKMQVEAIKHQGAYASGQNVQKDEGQRSVDIVAERNGTSAKQVQRYMRLTELVPDLRKFTDEKKLSLTAAVEFSFIKPKNQRFIAVSLEGQQNSPSLSQAQKLRTLDKEGKLNGDVIDGILCEQKKEVEKVIISGEELHKYFGKDKTPRQMKDQIIKLLDDWAGKHKELAPPQKKPDLEK